MRRASAARVLEDPAHELGLLPDSVSPDDAVGGTEPLSFRRSGVRDQVMRRLRRGLYPIEDALDLHGLNQAAARDTLSEFLNVNRDAGRRCLKIVHGKGYRSGARGPILKIAVNAWLKRHPDHLRARHRWRDGCCLRIVARLRRARRRSACNRSRR
jgi:DNA-nicking Smr family endonuclease